MFSLKSQQTCNVTVNITYCVCCKVFEVNFQISTVINVDFCVTVLPTMFILCMQYGLCKFEDMRLRYCDKELGIRVQVSCLNVREVKILISSHFY